MKRLAVAVALVLGACTASGSDATVSPDAPLTTLPDVTVAPSISPPSAQIGGATTTSWAPRGSWYLLWVPVELPEGFAGAVAAIDAVQDVSHVRVGLGMLAETRDRSGRLVNPPPDGFFFPVDIHAFADPAAQAAFMGEEAGAELQALGPGEVALGDTSSQLRGVGEGATLTFDNGVTVVVAAVIDDALIGDGEVITTRSDPEALAEVRSRYVVFRYEGDRAALERSLDAIGDDQYVLRAWGETRVFRHGDMVRSQVAFKARFGEFAIQPSGSGFVQDQAWKDRNIAEVRVPLLGTFRCHVEFAELLHQVMTELEAAGEGDVIDPRDFAGCYNARYIANRPDISHHSFGAAADINIFNPLEGPNSPVDPALLEAAARAGLTSGYQWVNPDPGHFEWYDD